MKLYVTMAVCLALAATAVNAQRIHPGIKAGLNVYTLHNDNGPSYDARAGFHAGFLAHIHVDRQFAIQPEIVYSSQGARYTVANTEFRLNLDYINVPVLFQYMFNNGFRIEAGPQVGFLINAKSETGNIKTDVNNSFKAVDFSLAAGVSYVNTRTGLGADLRYNFGFGNINETSSIKSVNRGLQAGLFFIPGNH
jgi:Outer membrane protein beta-barrel domain